MNELGWVVERLHQNVLEYWTGRLPNESGAWSEDNLLAVRFARKQDAWAVQSWILDGAGKVSEHMWMER